MTGLGSFWRLSWTATRTPRARAASRWATSRWPMGSVRSAGTPKVGVEPVEGLFAGRLGWPVVVVVDPVVGVELEGLGGRLVVG